MKPAKCKVCGAEFVRVRPLQQVCSPACAIVYGKALAEKDAKVKARIEREQAKADRKATREKLDAMRTKPQLVKLAKKAFNSFIRARDAGKPCISCGAPLSNKANTYDAGHYRSVGSAPHMRFVEANVHGQCKHCNKYLAGNHVEYRKGLIKRIGLEAVEAIEADQTPRKYTRDALIDLARHYRELTRKIKAKAK